MSVTTVTDPAAEVGEAHQPERLPRCRRLVTIKGTGRSTAARVGPPAHERCSAEVADQHHESKLCPGHLASAMRDLVAAGAVVVRADLPVELQDEIGRWEIARSIIDEKIADGTLVRTASGGLIEAGQVVR
jgi:hypothetical protein